MSKYKKLKKRLPYIEVFLVVSILILFITAHLLHTIPDDGDGMIWMGVDVDNLITDVVLYGAIFLTFILFFLIIYRNFSLKKRKRRK